MLHHTIVHGLLLVLLAQLLGVGRTDASRQATPADEFALLETPLLNRSESDVRTALVDLELAILTLARLDIEEDCEHLLRIAGALRWKSRSTQTVRSEPGDQIATSAIQELEELAWMACALRSRDDFADAELVSWSIKACLMDLTERDDPESHWIRGQGPSRIELFMLCRNAGNSQAVSSRPKVGAALQYFERAVRERSFLDPRADVPADSRPVETLERSVQNAARLLEDLRSALMQLRARQR